MIKRIKIFRFPAALILVFALYGMTAAQQPQPQQAVQNTPTATAQQTGVPGVDLSSRAGSGKQASNKSEFGVKNIDQAGNREQDKDDKDPEATRPKHHTHFHLGTVTVAAGYTHYPGGFFNSFYPFGFYSYAPFYAPFYYDPFYGPFYYSNYSPYMHAAMGRGQVRLSTPEKEKNSEVYIDNAYAGTVGKLKSIWLDPGAYDLAVKGADGSSFQQRIYVLSGKTIKIKPELSRKSEPPREERK